LSRISRANAPLFGTRAGGCRARGTPSAATRIAAAGAWRDASHAQRGALKPSIRGADMAPERSRRVARLRDRSEPAKRTVMGAAASHATSPEPVPTAEFAFAAADFERVRALIHQRAGISINPGKQAMVYSRLARRLRQLGHRSFGGYLHWLENASSAAAEQEWQEFINCLTTNLTSFFREEHHFAILANELQRFRNGPVRIWCSAASTGQEPYSLAITVIEALGAHARATLLGSDIDTNVLVTAERGVYPADSRGLSIERLHRHFLRGTGANTGFIRVKPELRRLVEFRLLNLMDPRWLLGEPFDMVFCRNVMIYFDTPTQRRVLERMHAVMRPHGLLFAGHSENFVEARDLFRLRGRTVYERL
jgi:chemotaxis protein methyltransferase CheR